MLTLLGAVGDPLARARAKIGLAPPRIARAWRSRASATCRSRLDFAARSIRESSSASLKEAHQEEGADDWSVSPWSKRESHAAGALERGPIVRADDAGGEAGQAHQCEPAWIDVRSMRGPAA